jgi:hypothetical protein
MLPVLLVLCGAATAAAAGPLANHHCVRGPGQAVDGLLISRAWVPCSGSTAAAAACVGMQLVGHVRRAAVFAHAQGTRLAWSLREDRGGCCLLLTTAKTAVLIYQFHLL